MKFGIIVPQNFGFDRAIGVAQLAERLGIDSIWMQDHVFMLKHRDYNDSLTMLTAIAAQTKTIKLGTLVLNANFHYAPTLAKQATTIQNISKGRFILGLGAGWNRQEFTSYGFPFENRFERLKETIILLRKLWSEEKTSFNGKIFKVKDAYCNPKPCKPIPILIGGSKPSMLKLVEQYADQWNMHDLEPKEYNELAKQIHKPFKTCSVHVIIGTQEEVRQINEDEKKLHPMRLSELVSFDNLRTALKEPKRVLGYLKRDAIMGTMDEVADTLSQYDAEYFMFPLRESHYEEQVQKLAELRC